MATGARSRSGVSGAASDLAGALVPLSVRGLQRDLTDRLRKVPTRLNEYGFDDFGMHPATVRSSILPTALLYKYYFRVETFGIDRVPAGRVCGEYAPSPEGHWRNSHWCFNTRHHASIIELENRSSVIARTRRRIPASISSSTV